MKAISYIPARLLEMLADATPVALASLPEKHGIYGLVDHGGAIRYIGVTAAEDEGFLRRINSRHVTGSEGRSHKFKHAYNTGRMWRSRVGVAGQNKSDAEFARKIRAAFCRAYCKAVYLPIPRDAFDGDYFAGLRQIESPLQTLAPAGMRRWEKRVFQEMEEPTQLLDALLDHMGVGSEGHASLERQATLYRKWKTSGVSEHGPNASPTVLPFPDLAPVVNPFSAQHSSVSATFLPVDGGDWYFMRARKAQAYGKPVDGGGFLVRKGSTAVADAPIKNRERAYRDRLVREGVLVAHSDRDLYRFRRDYVFSSPSLAGGIVKDGNCSGPSAWKPVAGARPLNQKA